jgi:diaminopimelate decarboxylase
MKTCFVCDTLTINNAGRLSLGGADVAELARRYGTPLFLMDEGHIRGTCARYVNALKAHHAGEGEVLYAAKAFCCKEICRIIASEGMGVLAASGGELYTARAAGVPMERVTFHGNNKTPDELTLALDYKVKRIVVDNLEELELLSRMASERGQTVDIQIRIKPGIDAHTHNYIKTAIEDSKFGFGLGTGEAAHAAVKATQLPGIKLRGIHCHIGSQIFESDPYEEAARLFTVFLAYLRDGHGIILDELSLGGGFGIKYIDSHTPRPIDGIVSGICAAVEAARVRHSLPPLRLILEPGRSVVASSGITVYTVGSVKEIPEVRTYVIVDGGMADNPRYVLYNAMYEAVLPERPMAARDKTVTLAGRSCESGDILGREIMLPSDVKPGDLVAVQATGAYCYAMASNYNRFARPPVVMVRGGADRLAIRRETYDDILRCDQ